jgi:hypothetical protein
MTASRSERGRHPGLYPTPACGAERGEGKQPSGPATSAAHGISNLLGIYKALQILLIAVVDALKSIPALTCFLLDSAQVRCHCVAASHATILRLVSGYTRCAPQ